MQPGLTELDKKLGADMIVLCQRFIQHEIGLKPLVNGLEALLDAGAFKDQKFRELWYTLWLPLEVRNAMGEADWPSGAKEEVEALQSFLVAVQSGADFQFD